MKRTFIGRSGLLYGTRSDQIYPPKACEGKSPGVRAKPDRRAASPSEPDSPRRVRPTASLAGALVDRLTHHAHIVHIVGDSFRFRHSLSRAAGETGDGNAATGRRRKLPDPTMDKEVDF
ncbi:MAG: ATP-binding protein [Candidatus Xenobium sp.]